MDDTTTDIPAHLRNRAKRPSCYDEQARREAANEFARTHRHAFDVETDEDAATLAEDVARRYRGHGDGFELMSDLSRRDGYPGSSEGVETLDEYIEDVATVAARHEREWVAHNGIEPTLAIGDQAEFPWGHERRTGRVARIDKDGGKYLIEAEGIKGLAVIAYERATRNEGTAERGG